MEETETSSRSSLTTINGESYEIFSIVWLGSPNSNIQDNVEIQQQFRSIINCLRTFQDIQECENYIESLSKEDRMVLVVDDTYAFKMVTRSHDIRQLISIYIHSTNPNQDFEWIRQYKKVSIHFDTNHSFSVL